MRTVWYAINWLLLCDVTLAFAQSATAIRIEETISPGQIYRVHNRVELTGKLQVPTAEQQPAMTVELRGESHIEYEERILESQEPGVDQKTLRLYRRVDFSRTTGTQKQEATIRPDVRRMVILRNGTAKVPFSPDGPLTWGEIDVIRTDVFTPTLTGLLPRQPVRPGDRWQASPEAIRELTDIEKIDEGSIECKLEQITTLSNRSHARIGFQGTLRGINEDGPNQQRINGTLYFDLQSHHISYISLLGESLLLDKDGRTAGRVEGKFTLTRQKNVRVAELEDAAIATLKLQPDAQNTQLLYDDPDLGIRFLFPRRWRVNAVQGHQLTLEGSHGGSVLITLESRAKTPTAQQYMNESQTFLMQKQAKFHGYSPVHRVMDQPKTERFAFDVELNGKRALLEYYVLTQPEGGALFAARFPTEERDALRTEVDRIVRSTTLLRTIPERPQQPSSPPSSQ